MKLSCWDQTGEVLLQVTVAPNPGKRNKFAHNKNTLGVTYRLLLDSGHCHIHTTILMLFIFRITCKKQNQLQSVLEVLPL